MNLKIKVQKHLFVQPQSEMTSLFTTDLDFYIAPKRQGDIVIVD
jgi:hypothetical protein